jgi:hypothetical protein
MQLADDKVIEAAFRSVGITDDTVPPEDPTPMPDTIPPSADGERILEPSNGAGATTAEPEPALLNTITPAAWRGMVLPPMRWLALHRIPAGDVTILSGDGGGGKTTVALQLAVSVANSLGDWLGTTCEAGPVLFFSAEEPEIATSILTKWKACICILQSLPHAF